MARGALRQKPLKPIDQFDLVDNDKLRLSLIGMAERYNDTAREIIIRTYNDPIIHQLYKATRISGAFQHGSKNKVRRKIIEFPNGWVYDYIDTVLTALYGPNWLSNNKALRHELVKPWWVVEKL